MDITRRSVLAAAMATVPVAHAAAAATVAAAPAEPFTVGAVYPFSGSLALLGDESFRGLDLAADEVNAAGGLLGRPVAIARGDAADAAQAAAEVKRLIEQAKAGPLFGSFSSVVSFAASAAAEVAAVPYIELNALADPITARGFRLLFRTGPLASACGAMAVETVVNLLAPLWQLDARSLRIGLLFEDGLAGATLADAQEAQIKARGLQLTERIGYAATTLDLPAVVQRLRGASLDVVLHSGLPNDVVAFHRALKAAGWRPRMVVGTGGGYELNDTAQAIGADFEGVISVGVTPYRVSDIVAPGAAAVAGAYQRKYGAPPRSGHSLISFAGARAAFAAIRQAGSRDHEALRAALMAVNEPPNSTVGGFGVKFDAQGQNTLAVPYVSQWQQGVLTAVAPDTASVAALSGTYGG